MHRVINTNKEVPQPNDDALNIVALVKDSGQVTGYELSDGNIVSRDEGVRMARNHMIKDVAIAENKGTEYLRSLPDDTEANNISNLPSRNQDAMMADDWDEEWEFEMSGERPYGDSAFGESHLSK